MRQAETAADLEEVTLRVHQPLPESKRWQRVAKGLAC
jgi:hypothetical protein